MKKIVFCTLLLLLTQSPYQAQAQLDMFDLDDILALDEEPQEQSADTTSNSESKEQADVTEDNSKMPQNPEQAPLLSDDLISSTTDNTDLPTETTDTVVLAQDKSTPASEDWDDLLSLGFDDIDDTGDNPQENTLQQPTDITTEAKSNETNNQEVTPQAAKNFDETDDMEDAQKAQSDASRLLDQKPTILTLQNSQKKLIAEGDDIRRSLNEKPKSNSEKEDASSPAEQTTENAGTDADFDLLTSEIEQDTDTQAETEPETEIKTEAETASNMTEDTSAIAQPTPSTNAAIQQSESAPFGLFWNISHQQAEQLGFELQPAERKDYQNVYQVINPQQKNKVFDLVTAIFGEGDHLWCIFAQSTPQKDTPQASKVLDLYHTYYQALEQKYGNAQEYFTPNTYTEQLTEGDVSEDSPENSEATQAPAPTQIITSEMGNDNFLQELRDGSAELYATFENNELGITLGVSVDGDNQSYISIDYKNLKIMQKEQEDKLNNLISDI